MKHLLLFLALAAALAAQPSTAPVNTPVQKVTATGALTAGFNSAQTHAFLSGAAVTFNSGSTLTVNGTLAGTPTGGTLNASALTLTLPATVSGGTTSFQPRDSDLDAIAALTTTSFGRSTLTLADASAARTSFGQVIGTNVAPATSGTSILYGNGTGGFSNAIIGGNLSFTGGTLNLSTTPNIGAATGTSLALTGNLTAGGLLNFGINALRTDSTNRVQIGHTVAIQGHLLEVAGAGGAALGLFRFTADGGGPMVELRKSRDAVTGVSTIVQNTDSLGSITWAGANGTGYTNAAQIVALVDGTPGAVTDMPGRIEFRTTPDGSGTLATRLTLTSTSLTGTGNLTISGTGASALGGVGATVSLAGTSAVRGIRTATSSIDFSSMAAGAGNAQTMTITGVAVGDSVIVTTADGSAHPDEITISGFVSATNTVSVRAVNRSAGTYDPAAKTYRATVFSF